MSVQWEHCHLLRAQSAAAEIGGAGCLGQEMFAAPGAALKKVEMDLIPTAGAAEGFSS
jgi:hypothetical protein